MLNDTEHGKFNPPVLPNEPVKLHSNFETPFEDRSSDHSPKQADTRDEELDELTYDRTDMTVYDKTDTENNTEVIFDKTDTDMQTGSEAVRTELVFDGADTDATLETDLSFNDKISGYRRNNINGNTLGPKTIHSLEPKKAPSGTELSIKSQSTINKDSVNSAGRANKPGYETDEIGRTEDDFSLASFAESEHSYKSGPNLSGGEVLRRSRLSIGHDENKTEDDFSFASFNESDDDGQEDKEMHDGTLND